MAQGLVPSVEPVEETCGPFRIVSRKWDVRIFDWAFLSLEHDLRVPYQWADIASRTVNLEIAVEAPDVTRAIALSRALRLFLSANGVSPFATPTVSTHSINDFSNIQLAAEDPNDPRHERARSLASGAERVWMGGFRGSEIVNVPLASRHDIDSIALATAAASAERWVELVGSTPRLRVLEDAALAAPGIANVGQGILQMWTGLEALFPTVHAELSFRLALYLAQLNPQNRAVRFKQIKDAYKVRSQVAHGSDLSEPSDRNLRNWSECWALVHDAAKGIVERGELPSEDALESELLSD